MLTCNPTHEILGFLPIIKYKMKKALIFGVSGQDGAYLAKLLLSKGYTVYGTSRDAQVSSFRNLEYLGIRQQVQLESAALNDFRSVLQVLKKTQPDEVYNLAGQTSVGLSFEQPLERLRKYCGGDAEYFGGDPVWWGAD
jgi:GDPmannose 4,6-dehydratase